MDAFDLLQWNGFSAAGGPISEPAIVDQVTIDSRRIYSRNSLFVALKGEKQDGHHFVSHAAQQGAKYALVSHNYKPSKQFESLILLRVEDPLRAFQEIVKVYRLQLPTKIIGVTGSFGKTMVKDLLYNFLSTSKKAAASPESFNSQIGVPLSLLTIRREHEIAIIEAAISKKEEMHFLSNLIRPDFTILSPIGKKHLATLKDMETLSEETMKLIFNTNHSGWALLPNDKFIAPYLKELPFASYFWDTPCSSLPHASHLRLNASPYSHYQIKFPNNETYQGSFSTGYTYFLNLLNMTIKAAWLMEISSDQIKKVLSEYQPETMRTEIWKSPLGSTFINDTYCSDPQSIDQAFRHFSYAAPDQKKTFLFGGLRGQLSHLETDYRHIGQILKKANIQKLILYGDKAFGPLVEEVKNDSIEITVCENCEEALDFLKLNIHPNDLILIKGEKKVPLETLTEIFNDGINNNQCTINFAAIQNNIASLRKKLPSQTQLMIVVKALAYGTDDVRMAKFLSTCGIDILGVSYVDEGITLKRAGVHQEIFAINAANYEASKVVKWELQVGVSDKLLAHSLGIESEKQKKEIKIHLHVNTGMGRFGCRPEEAVELAQYIQSFPSLKLEGLMTHFACAEDPLEDAFTFQQIACFDQVIASLKEKNIQVNWIHAANSSGAIRFDLPNYNMVRIGLAAYGLYSSEETRKSLDLRLALSLTSRIVGINICKKGETISYGRCYTVSKEEQKIAVLPIGYFDGLHRNYSGKAYVLVRGMKAPMVGRICMDYMMVDVTDIPYVSVGDKVLIFGEDEFGQYLSPEDLATSGNSIVHELITCLGPRIQRIFVYEEGVKIR